VAVSDATAVSAVAEAPALDGLGAPAARRTARPAERGAKPRPRWRTPAIIGAVAAFAVIAGVLVARASGQRLPGNSLTGTVPNNKIDQELVLAVQQFQKGDAIDAIKTYDQILSVQPTNVEALTYKGWLLRLAGSQAGNTQLIDEGFSSIQEAERVDPSYPDPHFFAGEILLRDKNDPKDAITEFQTYLADNPPSDMGPEVQGEIQAAEAELTGKPQAGETTASTTTVPN
jgi:tetratricopeptide (TPR) repeat protein